MEKIIKKIAATSMVALAALFMTTSFASCNSDDKIKSINTITSKTKVSKAMAYYQYQFTPDFLKVADVSFTYTDSLGFEHTDKVSMPINNTYTWQYSRAVAYAKVPMTFHHKLTIKMKDKKDIPVQSTYQLGWNDKYTQIAGYDDNFMKIENQELPMNESPFEVSGARCKTVTYDSLEDAFKNKTDGFERTATDRVKVTVKTTGITIYK